MFIGLAVFTIQDSIGPPVVIKFFFWNLETSFIYTILVSFGPGILVILLLWISRGIRTLFRVKNLKKEIEISERQVKQPVEISKLPEAPES